jgi:uncharacterized protein
MSNHLSSSTSPYLLQHASNPVDWYPWSSDALEKARREDKPIFLSIGYAACHWCHVMAHESFEDPDVAALMNLHFVCIKVDREERPDLDDIYMSAVTALTGQGGWPMSVFLAPDLRPFYAGTYFPPTPRHGLPGFKELLQTLANAWTSQRTEIERVGAEVAARLTSLSRSVLSSSSEKTFDRPSLELASAALVNSYDWQDGGWGSAPRFPQPMSVEFLLRRHLSGDPETLKPALHVLRAMAQGGMYDVVGGGFARYSTDDSWCVPHFEKMLYDNAQLALVYLHAWQVTADPSFLRITEETLDFILRELTSPEGGFCSSLDADSEGQEGKYYVWTQAEIRQVLGAQSSFFESAYAVSAFGNWEGRTVLHRAVDDASLAARFNMTVEQVVEELASCHARLLETRYDRPRPSTDDKVLTAWNGLMLAAFAEAARVIDKPRYLKVARTNANFLLTALRPQGRLRRSWRRGQVSPEVFLEDYASLIIGLLTLYQSDFDNRWFVEAASLADEMLEFFADPAGGFFDTPSSAETVLTRPRDLQDNASPSGNALAVEALLQLAQLTGREDWRLPAECALALVSDLAPRYPTAFARWLSAASFSLGKVKQVALIGSLASPEMQPFLFTLRRDYRPAMVVAASSLPLPPLAPALLQDRPMLNGQPTAYVCDDFVCRLPASSPEALLKQL